MDPRRAIRDAFGRALHKPVHHAGVCPDCDADIRAVETCPGVFVATILHDDTCPRLRRMRGRS